MCALCDQNAAPSTEGLAKLLEAVFPETLPTPNFAATYTFVETLDESGKVAHVTLTLSATEVGDVTYILSPETFVPIAASIVNVMRTRLPV